jgi:hypothetical protein
MLVNLWTEISVFYGYTQNYFGIFGMYLQCIRGPLFKCVLPLNSEIHVQVFFLSISLLFLPVHLPLATSKIHFPIHLLPDHNISSQTVYRQAEKHFDKASNHLNTNFMNQCKSMLLSAYFLTGFIF